MAGGYMIITTSVSTTDVVTILLQRAGNEYLATTGESVRIRAADGFVKVSVVEGILIIKIKYDADSEI